MSVKPILVNLPDFNDPAGYARPAQLLDKDDITAVSSDKPNTHWYSLAAFYDPTGVDTRAFQNDLSALVGRQENGSGQFVGGFGRPERDVTWTFGPDEVAEVLAAAARLEDAGIRRSIKLIPPYRAGGPRAAEPMS